MIKKSRGIKLLLRKPKETTWNRIRKLVKAGILEKVAFKDMDLSIIYIAPYSPPIITKGFNDERQRQKSI